jgi:hypothetical protein
MDVSAAISLVNVVILIALLIVYAKIYKGIIAVFTIGSILFAVMLMLHNIIAVYAYFAMAPLYAEELLPYYVEVHLAEFAGIGALLKVTL